MILNNIGSKIISVGSNVLMPGDSMPISKELAESKPIQALVEKGFFRIEKDNDEEEEKEEEKEETAGDAKTEPAKRTRKAKVTE